MEYKEDPDTFLSGKERNLLNDYQCLGEKGFLGPGPDGLVFKMIQMSTNKAVAVKIVKMNSAHSSNQETLKTISRECYIHSKLNHENVISFVESFI